MIVTNMCCVDFFFLQAFTPEAFCLFFLSYASRSKVAGACLGPRTGSLSGRVCCCENRNNSPRFVSVFLDSVFHTRTRLMFVVRTNTCFLLEPCTVSAFRRICLVYTWCMLYQTLLSWLSSLQAFPPSPYIKPTKKNPEVVFPTPELS